MQVLVRSSLVPGLFLAVFGYSSLAQAGTVEACGQYQGVTVGSYIVQTDYWNKDKCPGSMCMEIDDQTGAFKVTKTDFNCGSEVAAFPSILYGRAFGGQSPRCDLPARVDSLKCLNSDWTFQPTYQGRWDTAYDIWLCPDDQCGPGGFAGGAEVMVWLDYYNTGGWKEDLGPVTLNGMAWEVWRWDVDDAGGKRTYMAYLAKVKTDSVRHLDLKKFLEDCQARKVIRPSWYLYAVYGGDEIATGGIPFTSKTFSVSVNKDCGARTTYVPAVPPPTPTPDLTPDVIPPPP